MMRRLLIALALALSCESASAVCADFVRQGSSSAGVVLTMHHWVCDTEAERPNGTSAGDMVYTKNTGKSWVWTSGSSWADMGQSGGGGAPSTAPYITKTPDAGLSAEQAMSALATGLVSNTTATGVQSIYAGTSCSPSQWIFDLSATGAGSCSQPTFSDLGGTVSDAQVPNNITVDLATLATTATTANAGDSATAFFGAGTLELARGGTGAGSLTANRCVRVNSGGTALEAAAADCGAGGGGGATVTRVAADVSNTSSTVWANVTGLTHAVSASTAYSFTCQISYTSAATTTALHLSISGPASPTAMRYTVEMSTTATARHNASQAAYDTVTNPATGGGSTALPAQIKGTLENGANAGTLAIRLKSEINASAVTVQRGSWCEVY